MKKILLIGGGILAAVIVISAASSSNPSVNGGNPEAKQAKSCDPKPCADADGFKVSISSLNRNAPSSQFFKPEAGNHLVTMQVTLSNNSGDKKSANPFDFQLRDSQGQEHTIEWLAADGCSGWQAVDLANTATLGPKELCFQAAGDPNGPLVLIWSPGFWSSKVEIPLQ